MILRTSLRRISSVATLALGLQFLSLTAASAQLTPPVTHPTFDGSILDWNGIPYGAERFIYPDYLKWKYSDFEKKSPPTPSQELNAAIESADLAKIKFLLDTNPALVNFTNMGVFPGLPPLKLALGRSPDVVPVAALLLSYGADVNASANGQDSALSIAFSSYPARSSDQIEQIAEILITHGADVNAQNSYGQTTLEQAIKRQDLFAVNLLLKHGAKLNETASGHSALVGAINSNPNSPAIVQSIVDAGADVNKPEAHGLLPIHMAMHLFTSLGEGRYGSVIPPIKTAPVVEHILVAKGADINAADIYGMTPLLFAIANHDQESVMFLTAHGAKQDALTQAFLAAATNDVPSLKLSLKSNTAFTQLREPDGLTLLHVATIWGAVEAADFLIQQGADVNSGDFSAETPFYLATSFSSGLPMLHLLMNQGADINRGAEFPCGRFPAYSEATQGYVSLGSQESPLKIAVRRNNIEEVDLLLAHGANIAPPSQRSGELFGTLWANASDPDGQARTVKIAKLLLAKGADLGAALKATPSYESYEPLPDGVLEGAIYNNNVPLFKFLMTEGQPYLDFSNGRFVDRALAIAAREARVEILTSLLARGKFVKNTPLLARALQRAVDPADMQRRWNTTHSYTFDARRMETIRLLLAAGAHVNDVDSNGYTGVDKITVLMHAASTGQLPLVQLLLEKGANIKPLDNQGNSALEYAIRRTDKPLNTGVVHLLLDQGVDIAGQSGLNAFFQAVAEDRPDVVRLLLARGIDVNARTSVSDNGETALIGAVRRFGSRELMNVLLKAGVDVNAKAGDGKTALAWALSRNDFPLVAVLRQAGATQ